jgi:hypothetical protein
LDAGGKAKAANHHQERRHRAEERCASREQNARCVDRIGPAAQIAEPADQHAPSKYDPQDRFTDKNCSLMVQLFLVCVLNAPTTSDK